MWVVGAKGWKWRKGRRGRGDEKETKKQLALGFQVAEELALFVHVNFLLLPWPVVCGALAGIARHALPNSACAGNNGAPVLRVWVLEGWWSGQAWWGCWGQRGATYYHRLSEGSRIQIMILEGAGRQVGWLTGWLADRLSRQPQTL